MNEKLGPLTCADDGDQVFLGEGLVDAQGIQQ